MEIGATGANDLGDLSAIFDCSEVEQMLPIFISENACI
jgi:hypothetical protein